MRSAIILCAACSARLGASSPDAVTPIDARPCTGGDGFASDGDGNCYVWFKSAMIWLDAKAACEALPGHLAIINSDAQNAVVAGLAAGFDTFIGATDSVTEGTFLWVDGTPLAYTHFRAGVPDNGGGNYQEDCLVIEGKKTPDDTWDDRPCDPSEVPTSGKFPYVCEY